MSVSAIIFLSVNSLLLLVILAVVTGIMLKQKKGALRNEDAIKGCNAILDEQKEQISRVLQGNGSILELVKKDSETMDKLLRDIPQQMQLLQDIKKGIEAIKQNNSTERIEGFCGQIMNRVISLEEKIYDLKRVQEQIVADCKNHAPSQEVQLQTAPPSPENNMPPTKGKLIADLVKSIDPGDNATPAQKKKFEMQVEIINMVDEVLKISDLNTNSDFTLTLDTDWVKELGFNYEQIARVDTMLLARLFKLDAEDIIYHLSDGFFLPKTCSGKSIFWNFASSRGDDFEREYAREPGAILSESISSFGKGFWKMLSFDGETKAPDYVPCFQRVFYYCEQKDYFNRVIRKL
ncbi:MAG: hypothetical protein J5858_01405 [Lentisphaeria bacterium]|nr:hypothetical protein [Lentisphaeria bacterium]